MLLSPVSSSSSSRPVSPHHGTSSPQPLPLSSSDAAIIEARRKQFELTPEQRLQLIADRIGIPNLAEVLLTKDGNARLPHIVAELTSHKLGLPFTEKVSDTYAKSYYSVIKEPMYLKVGHPCSRCCCFSLVVCLSLVRRFSLF
jgi:hypothetical protein